MDIRNVFMVINTFQIWFNGINPKKNWFIHPVHHQRQKQPRNKTPNVNTSSLS